MKRDWDVIRAIMLRVEEGDGGKEISSEDLKPLGEALVAYNMLLLVEGRFADGGGRDLSTVNADVAYAYINRLTWEGHELLDKIRGDTLWARIKDVAKEKGVDITLDTIKALAKIALERLLGAAG